MSVKPATGEPAKASSFACLCLCAFKFIEASSVGVASVLPTALRMLLSAYSFGLEGGWKSSGVHTSDSILRLPCFLAVPFDGYEYDEPGDVTLDGKDNGESNFEWLEKPPAGVGHVGLV
jgi:hypothetical protein